MNLRKKVMSSAQTRDLTLQFFRYK